ncbi:MAG: type II secretion system protein [Mariniblastus sp.]
MTSPRTYSRNGLKPGGNRAGFTLVEILMAITVIAILAGLLTPVVFAALNRARETTVIVEMNQMDLAIENFKGHFGFYPPAFGPASATAPRHSITSAADMLPYLNRMAPSHLENSPASRFPGTAATGPFNTRLLVWWEEVGRHLDDKSGLVFWLSAVSKNKQFPLTGGITDGSTGGNTGSRTLAPYAVDKFTDGLNLGFEVERQDFFSFKDRQLVVEVTDTANGFTRAYYNQAYGDENAATTANPYPLAFRMLDANSYAAGGAYYNTNASVDSYVNPKSYQLITFGMDGTPGNGAPGVPTDIFNVGPRGEDNICNFAQGQLQKYAGDFQ